MLDTAALDAAIDQRAEEAFVFLERLVSAPSTLGNEAGALAVFGDALTELGFAVSRVPIPDDLADDPRAGIVPPVDGERFNVLGAIGPAEGPALLLNGHIDVVPADYPEQWSSPPFAPRRDGGRLYGRGCGDMKGGFAMGVLALGALLEVAPEAITGPLSFLAVIEEECTGNGALGAAIGGVLGDAVVLLEPTDLDVMIGGIGVMWCDVELVGRAAHAQAAHRAVNPFDLATALVAGLREWSAGLGEEFPDPDLADSSGLYNLNVGEMHTGDWPSSVPAAARLRLRLGYPRAWSPDRAEREIRDAVAAVAERDGRFPVPPTVRLSGFRAPGYLLDPADRLVRLVADAHESAHGTRPGTFGLGSTTDARTYLEYFGVPALCYGPAAENIHGIDESVDLDSIVAGARTLARFVAAWYAAGVAA